MTPKQNAEIRKILIVDDDEDIAVVVKLVLVANGYLADIHGTGVNVPDVVKKHKPDLILLDVNLPGKSGTDVCKELKSLSVHPPIVLFSAHAKKDITQLICSADGFIGKPFEIDVFLETIRAHVA